MDGKSSSRVRRGVSRTQISLRYLVLLFCVGFFCVHQFNLGSSLIPRPAQLSVAEDASLTSIPKQDATFAGGKQVGRAGADISTDAFPHFAIAVISMGKGARETLNVERIVQSIRNRGQWAQGRIVLISDNPSGRFNNITASDEFTTMIRIKSQDIRRKELKNSMPFKRFKTQVLDLLDEDPILDNIEYVVYVDVDIVIGKPLDSFFRYVQYLYEGELQDHKVVYLKKRENNAKRIVAHMEATENVTYDLPSTEVLMTNHADPSFMMMFAEQGGGPERAKYGKKMAIWHGGIGVFHRRHSKACLEAWREVFDSQRFTRDQKCMMHMFHCLGSDALYDPTTNSSAPLTSCGNNAGTFAKRRGCSMITMDHRPYLHMPTAGSMSLGTKSVFVHLTDSGRAHKLDKDLQFDYFHHTLGLQEDVLATLKDQTPLGG